jgi:predicted helicase
VDVEDSLLVSHSDLVYQLNEEAIGANRVRQEQPVMVVLGNPPYNRNSTNQGTYITDLMNEYAMKGSNGALNDDYIKFIRYAQNLVDQNGSGVVAYISNNSFLSSVAMTNMRKSLLESFDEIYVLNFTFDQKDTYEKVKDRVFETVKTPVCIYFFVKTGLKAKGRLGDVYYKEFQGAKSDKFKYLNTTSVNKEDFKQINLLDPEYYFYPLDKDVKKEYTDDSFALDKCFNIKGSGIKTNCDRLVLDTKQARLKTKIDAYFTKGELSGASNSVNDRKNKNGVNKKEDGIFTTIPYRPFDTRQYFDSDLTQTRCENLRKHEQAKNQVFLSTARVGDNNDFSHILLSNKVGECVLFSGKCNPYYYPLYIYREATPLSPASQTTNFTTDFLNTLSTAISKSHQDDPTLATDQTFSSLDAMDYIYGVLNDKAYTTKYNQFLKSNYPRVPYPDSIATFNRYKDAGSKLRVIHLDDTTEDSKSTYNATTNNKIEKVTFSNNKLYFNKSSFFDNITQDMFDFKIGASQPLKNWLESRKEDSFDESMVEQFLNVIYKVRNSI